MCVRAATFPALPPRVHSIRRTRGPQSPPKRLLQHTAGRASAADGTNRERRYARKQLLPAIEFQILQRRRERERQTIRSPASLLDPDTRTFPLLFFFLFILKFFHPLRERRGTANNPQIKYTRSLSFFLCKTRGDVLLTAPVYKLRGQLYRRSGCTLPGIGSLLRLI